MTKQITITKNTHERLTHLQKKTGTQNINDTIQKLLETTKQYNNGTLKVGNKKTTLTYNKGKLTEIHIE